MILSLGWVWWRRHIYDGYGIKGKVHQKRYWDRDSGMGVLLYILGNSNRGGYCGIGVG